ncbi:hypothetical protein BH11MYX1_BH11MYX1_01540 [soil metagenome]
MRTDILTLLHRDHEDIEQGIIALLDRTSSIGQIRTALDGVRLGLTAHAEAEDIVFSVALSKAAARAALSTMIQGAAESHRQQERTLAELVVTALGSREWFARASRLLGLVHDHAGYEERNVLPAIRELAPDVYPTLAGMFATERLRQLSMLLPSAPVYIADLARAM